MPLQVNTQDAANGYRMFIRCSQWWSMKTPFYNWFTKNYATMVVPLGSQFELDAVHVSWLFTTAIVPISRLTKCSNIDSREMSLSADTLAKTGWYKGFKVVVC